MSIDRNSPAWRAVAKHCAAAIEAERNALERPISFEETMEIRGRLTAYREILALADVKPEIKDTDQLY